MKLDEEKQFTTELTHSDKSVVAGDLHLEPLLEDSQPESYQQLQVVSLFSKNYLPMVLRWHLEVLLPLLNKHLKMRAILLYEFAAVADGKNCARYLAEGTWCVGHLQA